MRHYLNTAFQQGRKGKIALTVAGIATIALGILTGHYLSAFNLAVITMLVVMVWHNVELVDILRRINRLDAHRHQIATSDKNHRITMLRKALEESGDRIKELESHTTQANVTSMCAAFGQDVHHELHEPSAKVRGLRIALLTEEYKEYLNAEQGRDIVEIADALGDMTVIIYGTAAAYGINLDSVVAEIHRSNMTKLDADGNVIRRADGKIMKPDTYEPPQLAELIGYDEQRGPWSDGQEAAA